MEVAARVGFRVLLRNFEQLETSPMVCCGGFASPLAITFLVACSACRRGDDAELVNNISYLLCDSLERTHDAQHRLGRRKLCATILACFELRVASHRRSFFFKTAKPVKTLCTAHGIFSESHFNRIVRFIVSFS
jgi:hypothetical protein